MPTGVALRDVREQLFHAAERILARSGPSALTSRAVTDEAGCAKGVLHKHFADFDGFLADLVADRIARVDARAAGLIAAAGTGTVAGNLADALSDVFGPVAASIVSLITFRDGLRARLRRDRPTGVPLAAEIMRMTADYLAAERDLGRIVPDADERMLALTIVGGGHLLVAGGDGTQPPYENVHRAVSTVIAGVTPR